jgi:hypothetical protein
VVSLKQLELSLKTHPHQEYQCQANLNLYDSPTLERLATQAVSQRQLRITPPQAASTPIVGQAVHVQLCEDEYPAWLPLEDLDLLEIAEMVYCPILLTEAEIHHRLPQVIAFAHSAMNQPNHYLWGGTCGPNYDCSGLTQTAFAVAAIWLPRDAYQQEAFTQAIAMDTLQPGDLVFFGPAIKATHVGLYLGEGYYIHSSGRDQGRNGIGIDHLSEGEPISQTYYRQLRGAGRVVACYQPQSHNP